MTNSRLQVPTLQFLLLFVIGGMVDSCVEPFDAQTNSLETALVIETTITDEVKKQEILLSRASEVEDIGRNPEQNAIISIVDDAQNEYVFEEISAGRYVSVTDFGTQPNASYQLLITTSDGRKYASTQTKAPEKTTLNGFMAIHATNDNGQDGVSMVVTNLPSQAPRFFRYEYEETYKIIARYWTGQELFSSNPIILRDALENEHICYATKQSEELMINQDPENSTGSDHTEFELRFVGKDDYIIAHRYSILVKQYSISNATFVYLETLKKFSGQESVFSQTQPGFFNGNLYSESDADEKVLGYFEVSSLSTKRIYFNYADLFSGEPLPTIGASCRPYIASSTTQPTLNELLRDNQVRYYSNNSSTKEISVVDRVCADCTVLGSSEVPDFWEE